MDFYANPNKSVQIQVGDKAYLRHAVRTHFITQGENYIEIIGKYISPIYKQGDILFLGEKVIALCQNRVCHAKDIKISRWARFLSRFASSNSHGIGVDNPYKMQLAIDFAGLPRVIFAAICAGIGKIFGKRGLFYSIVGKGVSGIDGFYGKAFDYYRDKGILLPENPDGVCSEIKNKLGIDCVLVDANDLGIELLGKSHDISYPDDILKSMIRDNPAGQSNQQTPMILVREKAVEQNMISFESEEITVTS